MTTPDDVHAYWFGEPATDAGELARRLKRWYMGGTAEDAAVRERFGTAVERAVAGELDAWAATPRGRVALIVLLDQMTRMVFRGEAGAFEGDARAQRLATDALDAGLDEALTFEERQFLLMPLLHAEDLALLDRFAVEVRRHVERSPGWARPLLSAGVEQAAKYRDVVARFGRFPHRNAALGRASTPEEMDFLRDWAERAQPEAAKVIAKA